MFLWMGWIGMAGLMRPLTITAALPPLTWIWANPAPHGNNIVDMLYTNGTYFQVAEQGQIYSSVDLAFWRRHETQVTNALRSACYFGNRFVVTGEEGLILQGTNDFTPLRLGTTDWLEGIAASTNLLVAVGDNAAIYTSANGTQWQRQSVPFTDWLRSVCYGKVNQTGIFVAVGESGRIASSPNGTTWTIRAGNTTQNLNKVAYVVDRFVAVGDAGTVLTSKDAVTWSAISSGATNDLYAVAGNGVYYMVAGSSELRMATAVLTTLVWRDQTSTSAAAPAPQWTYLCAVHDGTDFWAGGRTGMLVQGAKTNILSLDHVWTPISNSPRYWLWDVTRAGNLYAAVGDHGTILTSGDGATWNWEYVPNTVSNTVFLGLGGHRDELVAVGNNGAILYSTNSIVDVVSTNVASGQTTLATNQVSSLGITWTAITPRPTTSDLQGVCYNQGLWLLAGGSGSILTSTNATNWTVRTTSTTEILSSVAAFPGGYVAVGDMGTILTSPNGTTWTQRATTTTNWLYRVRYLANQLWVVGQNGAIFSSPDGVAWTSRVSGTTKWLNDIALFKNHLVAIGTQGAVLESADGSTWSPLAGISLKSVYGLATSRDQMVLVGVEGVILRAQAAPVQIVAYSRQGSTNLFQFSGYPGKTFSLQQTADLKTWNTGAALEVLDNTGLFLHLQVSTNGLIHEFYRPTP